MTWQEAIERFIAETGCERMRILCADDHPDAGPYRALMIRLATGEPDPPLPKPAVDPAEILGSEALRAYLTDHPCGGC